MGRPTLSERAAQMRRLLVKEGYAGVTARLLTNAARRVHPVSDERLRVSRADLVRAAQIAADGWKLPPALALGGGERMKVAWVCAPAGEGAGGFTTMSRIAVGLERAGHECTIYLHDRHGWSLEQHRRTVRKWWPSLKADVRDLADGIEDSHAIFATSWETAYPVLGSPARGVRFYFVQDFEPSFYPAGSQALLAEATYSFGFHGITAGRWLARKLERDYGMAADHFDFGCDLARYRLREAAPAPRTGVCMYSRPSTPRRAFELAVAALDLFSERHPEIDIHLYGESVKGLPFAVEDHGLMTPSELNDLYNRCIAGLSLSATNVSLVPYEMLAAGCIPVVNDAEHNRVVLDNAEIAYAPATPFDLAGKLSELVSRAPAERVAAARVAAASVQGASWEQAGADVERAVSDVVEAASRTLEPTLETVL